MNRIFFYILYGFSKLPLPFLYILFTPFFWFMTYVYRYRHKVVLQNLTHSFPNKSPHEIKRLQNQFYRHFFDYILESIRLISITERELMQRFQCKNIEILDQFYDEKRPVALILGHYNNWEYAVAVNPKTRYHTLVIYAKLMNNTFNKLMLKARTKCGIELKSQDEIGVYLRKKSEKPFIIVFIADQSPKFESKIAWTHFLNQETAVTLGPERYAKILNMPVVFGHVNKVKRGYYEMEMELLTENPKTLPHGEITARYTKALESDILKNPQYWLWSHKRWKKNKKQYEEELHSKKI